MSNQTFMTDRSISVEIGGRTYHLHVSSEAEEENIRTAAKSINEIVEKFNASFGHQDKQDLMAMAALQMATDAIQLKKELTYKDEHLTEKLLDIDQTLGLHLQED